MQFQDWQFDKRVLRRNIRRDIITPQDYQDYLEALPDVSTNVAAPDEADEEKAARREAAAEADESASAAAPADDGADRQVPETIPPPPNENGSFDD